MAPKPKFHVPDGFLKLIADSTEDISLREAARRSGMSASSLVRMISGERGLPSDEKLLALAKGIGINPPEKLLIEAGRVGKPKQKILLRTLSALNDAEMEKVLKFAKKLEERQKKP